MKNCKNCQHDYHGKKPCQAYVPVAAVGCSHAVVIALKKCDCGIEHAANIPKSRLPEFSVN